MVSLVDRLSLPAVRVVAKNPRLSQAVFGRTRWGNQFGADSRRDPYPGYEVMRADGPVAWNPWFQQHFVTGYEEARQVLASSDVEVSYQRKVVLAVSPHVGLSDPVKALFGKFLLFVDPPDHTRLRALVSRTFTPRQMARIEPAVERLARDLLDKVATDPCPNMFASFNGPLPIQVISELLGIPEERWAWTEELSLALTKFLDPFADFDPFDIDTALSEGIAYFNELVEQRRLDPRDDLISALVRAEDEGETLTRFEVVAMIIFMMFAGHETTGGALGNAIVALAQFPEQRRWIRENPDRWPDAVEELLRWDTPLQLDPRTAAADMEIGGSRIKAGQRIIVVLGAANRDPRRWPDAGQLRLDREDARSISFGHGIHHCVGAALARMQMRIGLRAFVEEFGDYTIEPDEVEWKDHMVLRGPISLPVHRS